eukprot:Sspe_Gene.80984::Locus_51490_Transcript_1_1_Confidence_1.000_Length_734::g.80984::m.80984
MGWDPSQIPLDNSGAGRVGACQAEGDTILTKGGGGWDPFILSLCRPTHGQQVHSLSLRFLLVLWLWLCLLGAGVCFFFIAFFSGGEKERERRDPGGGGGGGG